MTKITIVIPNYNGMKFLKGCLDSVLKQEADSPEYAVLVVDNGSTDGSVEFMQREYPHVRVEALAQNTGFCHAVNLGIELSDSPYVLLLNNDTKVEKGFVKALYAAIENHQNAFSVSAKMLMWDKPELLDDAGDRYCALGWAVARGKGKSEQLYNEPCEVFFACGGAAIYRKSILDEIGYFDEAHFAYLEDLDIGYRAKIYGYRNYYEPSARVVHFGSASSGSRYNEWKTLMSAANNIYVVGKNMPLLQWIVNLPFLLPGFFVKFLFFCKKGMGKAYLRGFCKGFDRLFSKEGRANKVRFRLSRLKNYFKIQGQLYLNLLRILKKT